MSYTQLAYTQRYVIYRLNKRGETQQSIADAIGVNKSTVCRELKRNQGQRGYRPKQAHRFALNRREGKVDCRISDEDWAKIERLLRQEPPGCVVDDGGTVHEICADWKDMLPSSWNFSDPI